MERNLFGMMVSDNLTIPALDKHFTEGYEDYETIFTAKGTFTVETHKGNIKCRSAVIVSDMESLTGEDRPDAKYVVSIAIFPDIKSMGKKRLATERDNCGLGDGETLDYNDLYGYGHYAYTWQESCKEADLERVKQVAGYVAKMREHFIGFDLDKPVNHAGTRGWDCVYTWF